MADLTGNQGKIDMVNCKATFELRKDNRSVTVTRIYRATGKDELFAQIRSYAVDANHRGFNVESIKSETVWRRPRLLGWSGSV